MIRIGIIATLAFMFLFNTMVSDAAALQWWSCTVKYSVKDRGYSLAAFDVAVHDVEKATGLKFQKVPWNEADMKIRIGGKGDDKEDLGQARYYYSGRIQSSDIRIYRLAYQTNWITRMNVYRHELGHALGLNHVRGNDVMNKYVDDGRSKTQWKSKLKKRYEECS